MYIVRDNQSLLDIAIQVLGSCDALVSLASANGLSVTSEIQSGQALVLPSIVERRVSDYFAAQNLTVATLRNP